MLIRLGIPACFTTFSAVASDLQAPILVSANALRRRPGDGFRKFDPAIFGSSCRTCFTLSGSQFRNAALIVASPPCQAYSYMAMPWTKAKAKAAAIRADATGDALRKLNALFEACFRIQREACEAAGRHIPLIVENVKGAQPWVGRSRWAFGSFHLWGDVPALMPMTFKGTKVPGFRFDGSGGSFQSASVAEGFKSRGMDWSDPTKRGQDFTRIAGNQAMAEAGADGIKHHGSGAVWFATGPARFPSGSPRRKFASALIAKIPLPLSRHIAATFRRSANHASQAREG